MPKTKITGKNGDWEVDITPGNGDSIEVEYTPKAKADGCKNIRLSQTATIRAFDAAGKLVTAKLEEIYRDPKDNPFAHRKDDEIIGADGHPVAIDHVKCEGDPFYNGDDKPHDSPSRGDATAKPPEPTELRDGPGFGFGNKKPNIKKIVVTFEVCAICVDTGAILGCITYKLESTPTDRGDISPLSTKEQNPSADFKKAFKKFMDNHSKKKPGDTKPRFFCPDTSEKIKGPGGKVKDPFGEPIPDDFGKVWLSNTKEVGMRFRFNRDRVGGGTFVSIREAVNLALEQPGAIAVKFTWSGDQTRTVPTLVVTPIDDITVEALEPFVRNESRFGNDFDDVILAAMPLGHSHTLAKMLSDLEGALEFSGGPTTITLIAGLGGELVVATIGQLEESYVADIAAALAALPGTDDELLDALTYLGQNMGFE